MANCGTTKINLQQLARSGETQHLVLKSADFQSLEQDELLGGDVEATVRASEKAGDLFQVRIAVKGSVTVACDRCLEELVLPVDVEESILLSEEDSPNIDVLPLQGTPDSYDVVWDVYETIVTSLPLERTHPEGECSEDMLSRIHGIDGEAVEEDD